MASNYSRLSPLYQGMTADDRVCVLMTMLGRTFPHVVSRAQVRRFEAAEAM